MEAPQTNEALIINRRGGKFNAVSRMAADTPLRRATTEPPIAPAAALALSCGWRRHPVGNSRQVNALLERGVQVASPETVFVGPEVVPARVAGGVVLHPGCRLLGETLAIGPGCVLGEEGPVTVRDCQLGARVRLRGGSFEHATLLDDVDAGPCAHVRPGTLLEEHVAFGHAVGLKQTVLLPYVTLGSLINFCDCLMSGGTGPDNHSEVGSSYVHFNFTPHQEKATASLIGDVPRGVLLDQPPIFLGGQGGLVGPCRIAYGTVLAAGQICRHDVLRAGRLVREGVSAASLDKPYEPHILGSVDRRLACNLQYLGNLLALDAWWRVVRSRLAHTPWQQHGHAGALLRLGEMFAERLRQLERLEEKVASSLERVSDAPACRGQRAFVAAWPALQAALQARIHARVEVTAPAFLASQLPASLAAGGGAPDYLPWVRALSAADRHRIAAWLQEIVNDTLALGAAMRAP
jgi:UDP-N-acetylglucosamine/UDP-N-acetylgalactosamine diphosphorylase